jgi:hypothetical protein
MAESLLGPIQHEHIPLSEREMLHKLYYSLTGTASGGNIWFMCYFNYPTNGVLMPNLAYELESMTYYTTELTNNPFISITDASNFNKAHIYATLPLELTSSNYNGTAIKAISLHNYQKTRINLGKPYTAKTGTIALQHHPNTNGAVYTWSLNLISRKV